MYEGYLVRDVSGSDKDVYYVIFNMKRKIYKIHKGTELELVKVLNVSRRWYDSEELDSRLRMGYKLVEDLSEL